MAFMSREYKFEASGTMQKKDQHTTAVHSFRKLVKPLMRLVQKKQLRKKTLAEVQQNTYNSSLEDMRNDAASLNAAEDNIANEALEQRIYNEIRQCPPHAAVIVHQDEQQYLVPVSQEQSYIPVHFARTSSGTFFWTSVDLSKEEELQMRIKLDRWAQA